MKFQKLLENDSCQFSIGDKFYQAINCDKMQFKKHFNTTMKKVGRKEDGITFYRSTCSKIECSIIN